MTPSKGKSKKAEPSKENPKDKRRPASKKGSKNSESQSPPQNVIPLYDAEEGTHPGDSQQDPNNRCQLAKHAHTYIHIHTNTHTHTNIYSHILYLPLFLSLSLTHTQTHTHVCKNIYCMCHMQRQLQRHLRVSRHLMIQYGNKYSS